MQSLQQHQTAIKGTAAAVAASLTGFYLLCRTQTNQVFSDIVDTVKLVQLRRELTTVESTPHWNIYEFFKRNLDKHPDADALCFIGEKNEPARTLSFRQLDEASNRVAHWAIDHGIQQGDVVGLIMDNRPEFVITWLGIAKVGGVTALINTNLINDPLHHSIKISNASRFIIGIEHKDKAVFGRDNFPEKDFFIYGGALPGFKTLDALLNNPEPVDRSYRSNIGPDSPLLYIYTSGTTGNPKAGVIKHMRFFMAGAGFCNNFNLTPEDRIYCTLPLYHSAGGMVGIGMSWYSGACLVFRRKFSAKKFWRDVEEYNCTIMQYIGELCRYLLSQPPTPYDKSKIRLAIGNGLRPDIWAQFQERFNIDQIGEFYAATEGNTSMLNPKNKRGAVGWIPPLVMRLYPLELIQLEDDNETPKRGKNGLCIICRPGEKGELLGKIDNSDPSRKFDGYLSQADTDKKIIRDVLKKGDKYFRSGDLLKRDAEGFFYFVDRLGDTFRWKGENVATSEVEQVISQVPGITLVNVYGVTVPQCDGRAGMAALVIGDEFDMDVLYQTVSRDLPVYARPLFVRIMKGMDTTSTHKLQKVKARKEGFDINVTEDKFYFRDDQAKKFVPIDEDLFQKLQNGSLVSRL